MRRCAWLSLGLLFWLGLAGRPARAQDRFAVDAHIAVNDVPAIGETLFGYGFGFTYAPSIPFLALDTEFNSFPTSSTGNLGETQFLMGLKAGARVGRFGLFFKARPGVAVFGGGANPDRITEATHFAFDVGGGFEYYFAPHLALRLDLSDLEVLWGGARLRAGPGPVGTSMTTDTFQSTLGLVVHF